MRELRKILRKLNESLDQYLDSQLPGNLDKIKRFLVDSKPVLIHVPQIRQILLDYELDRFFQDFLSQKEIGSYFLSDSKRGFRWGSALKEEEIHLLISKAKRLIFGGPKVKED